MGNPNTDAFDRDDDAYEAAELERGADPEDPYRHAPLDSEYSDA